MARVAEALSPVLFGLWMDEDLARRAGRGDRWAADEIYRRYAARLWREVIWPLLRDDAKSEDALCETFVAALRGLPRFRAQPEAEGAGLWAWLAQIARRKALDEIRRGGRAARLGERLASEPADPPADPQGDALARERARERSARVAQVLADLRPRYAEAIRMRLQEGLSREDCARRLDVQVPTFDVVLHRALRAFRDAYLSRYGVRPEEEA
jgi:RNA polymerase sigma-70 factor (ECF subfamily)